MNNPPLPDQAHALPSTLLFILGFFVETPVGWLLLEAAGLVLVFVVNMLHRSWTLSSKAALASSPIMLVLFMTALLELQFIASDSGILSIPTLVALSLIVFLTNLFIVWLAHTLIRVIV